MTKQEIQDAIDTRRQQDETLYAHLHSGGTLTVRYRFTGSDAVVERGVDRARWSGIISKIARRYLKHGDVAEWPSYEFEEA